MKRLLKVLFFLVGFMGIFLLVFTLIEFKPKQEEVIFRSTKPSLLAKDTFSILTWNIGYAGLDKGMDFFYDGGKNTRTTKEQTAINLKEITSFIQEAKTDFYFIQEVDIAAKRSWRVDQLSDIANSLPPYYSYFVLNYSALFVPVPIFDPMGKVESGLVVLSKYLPNKVVRYAYPSEEDWPSRIFSLKRCLLVSHIPLANSKDLVLVNTHNSAFDNGEMRKQEMEFLREYLLSEYEIGNYVIVGGDWNQTPPLPADIMHFDKDAGTKHFRPLHIEPNYMPQDWKWISNGIPTNRFTNIPYKRGESMETLLDFFLVSPNVRALEVKTFDLAYENSDHQPVKMTFYISKPNNNTIITK